MAFKTLNLNMTTAALPLTTEHIPVMWVRLEAATGVADVKVGDKNVSSTNWGMLVEDGPAAGREIGPFGGGSSPFNLGDIWVLGGNNETLHVSYVTQ